MGPVEIIVVIAAVVIVAGVFIGWIVRKKQGKTGCDCGCSSCPHSAACHSAKTKKGREKASDGK